MGMDVKRGLFAGIIGILTLLSMTGVFAWLMLTEMIDTAHMDLCAAGILISASGVGALVCGRGEGSVPRVIIAETALILTLGLLNLLLYDGILEGLIPCGLLVCAAALAVVLTTLGKQKRTSGKYRRKNSPVGKLNKKYRR